MNKSFEHALSEMTERYQQDVQPQRDLWPAIERAMDEDIASKAPRHWGVAASVFVMLAVTSATIWHSNQPQTLVAQLSQAHQQEVAAILANYQQQAALTDNWQQQLATLDEAADAVKKALEDDPDNAALLGMLQDIYQQQLNLITKVHAPTWQHI